MPVEPDLAFKLIGGFAAACFIGALVTDVVYARAPDAMWVTFSVWLITIGLVVAGVAAIVGLVSRIARRAVGGLAPLWPFLVGFAAVVLVSLINAFVHSRDAWQAVVPEGLALSVVVVALLVVTPIVGRAFIRSRIRKAST